MTHRKRFRKSIHFQKISKVAVWERNFVLIPHKTWGWHLNRGTVHYAHKQFLSISPTIKIFHLKVLLIYFQDQGLSPTQGYLYTDFILLRFLSFFPFKIHCTLNIFISFVFKIKSALTQDIGIFILPLLLLLLGCPFHLH